MNDAKKLQAYKETINKGDVLDKIEQVFIWINDGNKPPITDGYIRISKMIRALELVYNNILNKKEQLPNELK